MVKAWFITSLVHNIMAGNDEELIYTPQSLLDTDLYKVNVRPHRSGSSVERKEHTVHYATSHRASFPRDTSTLQIHPPGS